MSARISVLLASGALLVAFIPSPPAAVATAAADAITCDGQRATIVGTKGGDRITGTPGRDVIVSLAGDDWIDALGGNDVVCSLAGADRIHAGSGSDRIFAGIDRTWADRGGANRVGDKVWPGGGDDYIDLGADYYEVTGELDRDSLVYSGTGRAVHADLRQGVGRVEAQGTDTVRVRGELGVVGTRFADTLIGGPNGDTLVGGWGDDLIQGRGGADWLLPDYFDEDGIHLDADVVRGGAGPDELTSSTGPDQISGGPGHDFLYGRLNPAAVLHGGPGDDGVSVLVEPGRPVELSGGTGDDYLALDYTRQDFLPHGTVDLRDGSFVRDGLPDVPGRLATFEDVSLDPNADWRVYGTDGADRISGADEVWSFGGDDEVYATGGADLVDAGEGNDLVWAYTGQDTCLNAERVRSCEVRSVPAVSGAPGH